MSVQSCAVFIWFSHRAVGTNGYHEKKGIYFILKNDASVEKIAEFNKLRPELVDLKGFDLAVKLGEFRNSRMEFADNAYAVSLSKYHIVGRCNGFFAHI